MSQEGLRDKKEKHENSRYLGMVLETQCYMGSEILTAVFCNLDILITHSPKESYFPYTGPSQK